MTVGSAASFVIAECVHASWVGGTIHATIRFQGLLPNGSVSYKLNFSLFITRPVSVVLGNSGHGPSLGGLPNVGSLMAQRRTTGRLEFAATD